jgi:hypothetical protein
MLDCNQTRHQWHTRELLKKPAWVQEEPLLLITATAALPILFLTEVKTFALPIPVTPRPVVKLHKPGVMVLDSFTLRPFLETVHLPKHSGVEKPDEHNSFGETCYLVQKNANDAEDLATPAAL